MSLQLSGVGVAYDGASAPAIQGVDLTLPDGQVLAVLGPSGSGKSTLLRAVAGLEQVSAGVISWNGEDLARTPTHQRGFALMFQDGQLFGHLTVAANVAYPLRLRRVRAGARAARVRELLDLVGLQGYDQRLPQTLSGGERQRVALARALAVEPRLLLLDEPLSALDASLRERLAADLRRILVAAGTTALLVTHDQEEAYAVADRLAVVRDGRLVQEGPVSEVWAHPADAETALFLGYARVLQGTAAVIVAAAGGLDPQVGTKEAVRPLAVRRSALVLDDTGPLAGAVVAARATPDQLRLVVDVDGVGEVDAVAPSLAHVGPGERVCLRVDQARLSILP